MPPATQALTPRSKGKSSAFVDEEQTDVPSTASNSISRRDSIELISEAVRSQVRQEVVDKLLEACGDDGNKKGIIRELASKAWGSCAATLGILEAMDTDNSVEIEGTGGIDDDDDDESSSDDTNKYKWADVESIQEIQDSPYEPGASAEVGLDVFEEFKALVEPRENDDGSSRRSGRRNLVQPTEKAILSFGEDQAKIIVMASFYISHSGMVYSPWWVEGKIRDHHIQGLSKPMLLMCLQEQRFSRAEKGVLSKLVEDLLVGNIVREALDDWSIDYLFPRLANCSETPFTYGKGHMVRCQKCEVFVARAYACMNLLKQYKLVNVVSTKVLACLRIMEDHVENTVPLNDGGTRGAYPRQIQVPSFVMNKTVPIGDGNEEGNTSSSSSPVQEPLHKAVSPSHNETSREAETAKSKDEKESEAVEKLDLKTRQILKRFPSIKDANLSLGKGPLRSDIRDALSGRTESAFGFFWRRQRSDTLPEGSEALVEISVDGRKQGTYQKNQSTDTAGSGASSPPMPPGHFLDTPVVKISLDSRKVLEYFPTIRAANLSLGRKTGANGVPDVLRGRQQSSGGFFWGKAKPKDVPRNEVAARPPSTVCEELRLSVDPPASSKLLSEPTEQVEFENGKAACRFDSLKDTDLSSERKVDHSGIYDVLGGERRQTAGHCWREEGSDYFPEENTEPLTNVSLTLAPRHPPAIKPSQAIVQSQQSANPSIEGETHSPIDYCSVPVEKVDMKTGAVLASYGSIKEANASLGKNEFNPGIWAVLTGKITSSDGFTWRKSEAAHKRGISAGGTKCAIVSTNPNEPPRKRPKAGTAQGDKRPREPSYPFYGNSKSRRPGQLDSSEKKFSIQQSESENHCSKVNYETLRQLLESTSIDYTVKGVARGGGSHRSISAMVDIVESPYQDNATAEVGEPIFDIFKALIVPASSFKRRQRGASDIAIQVFGETLANSVTEASSRIGVAGVVYSTEWGEGIIRGALPGPVPKSVLLLLLQEQRFARPGVIDALTTVVVNFDLCAVMKRALKEWNLDDRFWKVSQVETHASFTSRKSQCYRCLIFIARAFYCVRFFQVVAIPDSLMRKVDACLHILEANIGQRASRGRIGSKNKTKEWHIQPEIAQRFEGSDDEGSIGGMAATHGPPTAITTASHVLFQHLDAATSSAVCTNTASSRNYSRKLLSSVAPDGTCAAPSSSIQGPADTEVRPRAPKSQLYRSMKRIGTQSKSPASATNARPSESENNIEWYPHDAREIILNPIEIEIGWLVEEGIYCHRKKAIDWSFVWKYASPTLKVELRKMNDASHDHYLHDLVRTNDSIVAARFDKFRKEVRRKLHCGQYRKRMKDLIPKIHLRLREAEGNRIAVQPDSTPKVTRPSQRALTGFTSR